MQISWKFTIVLGFQGWWETRFFIGKWWCNQFFGGLCPFFLDSCGKLSDRLEEWVFLGFYWLPGRSARFGYVLYFKRFRIAGSKSVLLDPCRSTTFPHFLCQRIPNQGHLCLLVCRFGGWRSYTANELDTLLSARQIGLNRLKSVHSPILSAPLSGDKRIVVLTGFRFFRLLYQNVRFDLPTSLCFPQCLIWDLVGELTPQDILSQIIFDFLKIPDFVVR